MASILETLSIYMQPVGVDLFGESLFRVAAVLERLCRQIRRHSLRTVIARADISAPDSLDAWTLPDALWLAASRASPQINFYPMGEIAERAFKRTFVWLSLFGGKDRAVDIPASPKVFEKMMRAAVGPPKVNAILRFFLTEYFFEVCMDSERRWKTYTEADPCYRYHFRDGPMPRSLASESKVRANLREDCRKAAQDCILALRKSITAKNSRSIRDALAKMYVKALGESPVRISPKKGGKPPLNVVVGRHPQTELLSRFALDSNLKRLRLAGRNANIRFDQAGVQKFLTQLSGPQSFSLHSLSQDLLEIGVVVYIADQLVKRKPTLQRRLDILMPVRHLKEWNDAKALLAETISFLGRDEVRFYFVEKKEPADPIQFMTAPGNRCVCLFSGGLDSAAGTIQILQDGLEPVLVSHHSSSLTSAVQQRLVDELKQTETVKKLSAGADPSLHRLNLYVAKARKKGEAKRKMNYPKTSMTQFLRSFLFLSVAAVVAIESGINKVWCCENGPVALNPMFSEARLNTRTAHPRFVADFQRLIEMLFDVDLKIENPFLSETKAEVAERFAEPEFQHIVRKTNSCWNSFAVPQRAKGIERAGGVFYHDGDCLPCIIRRASLISAKLGHLDVPYLVDVFTEFPDLEVTTQVLIADYLRFCRNLERLDDATVLLEHPDFSVFVPGVNPKDLIAMYKRHCGEVIESFLHLGSDETKQLVLPPIQ